MAKKLLDLDTPFRRGEKVVAMRDLWSVPTGSRGRVNMVNGLSTWIRYWVRFDDGTVLGQIDHNDLARPSQVEDWHRRQEEQAAAAAAPPAAAEAEPAAVSSGDGGASSGIPEHLLERSRAAKARKLGG
jgi:hypothetical protein